MKKMKRTLSLMILAGLLTASLASCVVKGDGEGSGEVPSGTEPYYDITTGTTDNSNVTLPSNDPTQVTYAPADDIVYVSSASAAVKLVADVTQSKTLDQFTELHRVGTSTNWHKVEHEGQEYYISAKLITTDDIGEKTFTACDPVKTMYTSGSVNLRKYASSNNDFSTVLKTLPNGTEVTVKAQSSKGWSKVKCTYNGTELNGFMSSDCLTSTPGGESENYLQYFTRLDAPITMYVSTDAANIRLKPYADDRGTLVDPDGLEKGTEVKVIAKGTVEETNWSMVEWEVDSVKTSCFIATKNLSVTAGTKATLAQMLSAYPDLEKFEDTQTLYIAVDTAFGRSAPTRVLNGDGKPNTVKILVKKDQVKAVAVGKIEGQTPEGETEEITWCLIEDSEIGYYFVAYSSLTRNSDGTPSAPVISLDTLIGMYKFEKTSSEILMKTKNSTKIFAEPDSNSSSQDLAAGTTVTVVAKGETTDGFVTNDWYIVEYNSSYYFVIQSQLELA